MKIYNFAHLHRSFYSVFDNTISLIYYRKVTKMFAPYMKIEWCRAGLRYDEYVYTFGFQKGILTNQNTAKFA